MFIWKVVCLVLIFDYVNSLSEDNFIDEDDLKQLVDLMYRWSRAIHKFPEALWMLNSFPHFRYKHFNDDFSPENDWDDWPVISIVPSDDHSTTGNHLTSEGSIARRTTGNYFTDEDNKTTTGKHDNLHGKHGTTTKIPGSKASTFDISEVTHTDIQTNDGNLHENDSTVTHKDVQTTDEVLLENNSTATVTETIGPWNDNDTDALIIEIVQLLRNKSDLIKEIKEFIKGVHTKCNKDLWYAVQNIVDEHLTIDMLDASGKPASGIQRGNIRWLGDYRQCQSVTIPTRSGKGYSFGGFGGLYCYASWEASLGSKGPSVPLSTGICVPDSCSASELKADNEAIKGFFKNIPILNKIRVKSPLHLTEVTCQDPARKWTGGDIAYMVILAVFAVLIVAGTVCDLLKNEKQFANTSTQKRSSRAKAEAEPGEDISEVPDVIVNESTSIAIGKERMYGDNVPLSIQSRPITNRQEKLSGGFFGFLICFSVYSNSSKVLTVGSQQGQLSCLHGIRFLSLSWVIFGHVFVYAMTSVGNISDALEDIDSFSFQIVSQATLAVDSFFLLSGLLLAYLFFKECDKKGGNTNWIYYYVHRIWRLTPAFAMLLGFYTTLWLHMGSGPLWPAETDKGNCRKSWWWNLLYIVNFHDVNENCMGWTWYLANDMQFYIISPIFLILLYKLPIVGIAVVSIVTVISWIVTGVLSATNNFRLFMSLTENMQLSDVAKVEEDQWNLFNIVYDKPYCRIGPYLIGLLLGYALYRTSGRQNFMKMWMLVVGWLVATFVGLSVVFGVYHVEMGNITAAFYNALSRSAWSVALGWVIFVCLTGHAGPVNRLLSWNFWVPLSRLTYCAYLVHPMIMTWYYSSLQTMLHFQMNTMVLFYFGYLVFAYLVAFIASMAFESPMMALEKFLLKKFSK